MPEATICLNDEQASQFRTVLELDLPGEEPPYSDRDALVEFIETLTTGLERLDRLGWDDDRGIDRTFADDRERLIAYAARLMALADTLGEDHEAPPLERAHYLRRGLAPALVGVEILRQLEATR